MTARKARFLLLAAVAGVGLASVIAVPRAHAVSIELRDVASDRIERQRRAAEGKLPLPGTPDLSRFADRLAEKGLKAGAPILIRIFKAESELEVWMQNDANRFELFATYPICHWSGTLGPKIRNGDKQAPEGFYTVTRRQLHLAGRWPRSLNLGFPNVFDKVQSRTGSYILVHGGCSSVGCYAMTNTVIEEIYSLTASAISGGEEHVPVHVFPFRMTADKLDSYKTSEWHGFWSNLKEGYDSFQRTKRPPHVSVCETRYQFRDSAPEEGGDAGPLGWCGATAAALQDLERLSKLASLRPSSWQQPQLLQRRASLRLRLADLRSRNAGLATAPSRALRAAIMAPEPQQQAQPVATTRLVAPGKSPALQSPAVAQLAPTPPPCSLKLASCRKHVALTRIIEHREALERVAASRRRARTAANAR